MAKDKAVPLTPAILLDLLLKRGASVFMFKLRAQTKQGTVYIESQDDIKRLPKTAIIKKEKVTETDKVDLEGHPIFFEAQFGPIFYRGDVKYGYEWMVKRPCFTYQDVSTHHSIGWEIHDLWGDIEDLLHSDGTHATLRGQAILKDFVPPATTYDAFLMLFELFGTQVFDIPKYGDMEPYKVKNSYGIPDFFDIKSVYQKPLQRIKRSSDPLRITTEQLSAIYSVERRYVPWYVKQKVIYFYTDQEFAIDGWGIPIKVKHTSAGNLVMEGYYRGVGWREEEPKKKRKKGAQEQGDKSSDQANASSRFTRDLTTDREPLLEEEFEEGDLLGIFEQGDLLDSEEDTDETSYPEAEEDSQSEQ